MTVLLPDVPLQSEISEQLLDNGAMLDPTLGGPSQSISRLGDRYAVTVNLPALGEAAEDWIADRLRARAEGQTLSLAWPQRRRDGLPTTAVVDGAGQLGTFLAVRGLSPGSLVPKLAFFSFAGGGRTFLHTTTTRVTADGAGKAIVSLSPMLRRSPANGAALNFVAPIIEGFLDQGSVEWKLQQLRWIGTSFTLIENE
jgi:hypothetical protein